MKDCGCRFQAEIDNRHGIAGSPTRKPLSLLVTIWLQDLKAIQGEAIATVLYCTEPKRLRILGVSQSPRFRPKDQHTVLLLYRLGADHARSRSHDAVMRKLAEKQASPGPSYRVERSLGDQAQGGRFHTRSVGLFARKLGERHEA